MLQIEVRIIIIAVQSNIEMSTNKNAEPCEFGTSVSRLILSTHEMRLPPQTPNSHCRLYSVVRTVHINNLLSLAKGVRFDAGAVYA